MKTSLLILFSACSFAQNPPALPDWVKVEANIHYDKYPETVLDVMQSTRSTAAKRPGVLVIHGGGWTGGTKESQVQPICLRYLEKGFVVVNVEYRLAKAAIAPAAVQDALKAAEWFRKNAKRYRVDPNKIVVTGGSAGGHLSLMVGMTPKEAKLGKPAKVAAVVNFYGITDVNDQLQGPNKRTYAVTWVPEMKGREAQAKRVSPMTYVRKDLPPVLTLHGDADKTVPHQHGVMLTKALTEAGAQAELITVPQGKHGFPKETLDELYPKIFAFLEKHGIK